MFHISGDKQIIPQEAQAFDRKPAAASEIKRREAELCSSGSQNGMLCHPSDRKVTAMHSDRFRSFFRGDSSGAQLRWHCEPASWEVHPSSGALIVRPDAGTDFWQRTHYGFEADTGHFLHLPVTGDFTMTTQVRSQPMHQYDQAGLMVRISEACWLKTSIEFEPEGPNRLGAVVTNGQYSDWSTQSISQEVDVLWLRIRGEGSDYVVESSLSGSEWQQIRMARLLDRSSVSSVSAGVYACSPKQAGMQASFSFLELQPSRMTA